MDKKEFIAPQTGELVKISNVRGSEYAFVPAPLPPEWEWPNAFWPLLMKAHHSLASLNGIGTYLPDPQLILPPLQFREAVRSSNLEGTYTQPAQQALFEFDPDAISQNEHEIDSYREISNYGRALKTYFEHPEEIPLSLHLIRQLHNALLSDVRGGDKEPGKFRQTQNQIGRPPRFVPPPPEHLASCLAEFEEFLRLDIKQFASLSDIGSGKLYEPLYDPLVNAFVVHYQFETIHPFLDGNGRVGRLLLSIMITRSCEMSAPWLQMSPYFDANKEEYIDRLYAVSTQGKWAEWIEFCLNGVIAQAKDIQERCTILIDMLQGFRHRVEKTGGNVRLFPIIDNLMRIPAITIPAIAQRFDISYPTAQKDIENLVKAGIIEEFDAISRPRTFVCREVLDVIYD